MTNTHTEKQKRKKFIILLLLVISFIFGITFVLSSLGEIQEVEKVSPISTGSDTTRDSRVRKEKTDNDGDTDQDEDKNTKENSIAGGVSQRGITPRLSRNLEEDSEVFL